MKYLLIVNMLMCELPPAVRGEEEDDEDDVQVLGLWRALWRYSGR